MPLSSVVGAQSIVKPGVCTSTNKPASPFDGQVIYMTDVDQIAVWDGSQWTVLAPIAGGRNKVINGGMSVWQRGTSVSLSASTTIANSYTVDRFQMPTNASQACTVSRQSTSDSTNLPNIQYCARIQRNSGQTGTGNLNPSTSLESVNSISLAGKKVILSFYARAGANYSATSNALGVTVASGTGTDQNIQNGFTGQSTFASGTATLTTSWQRFTYSGTVSNSATQVGMFFTFTPTGTAGASDYFEITGIQLEEGAVATPFEFEDAQVTLAKCQRYYQKSYSVDVAPATNGSQPGIVVGGTQSVPNNGLISNVRFHVSMRTSPAITIYSYTTSQLSRVSDAYTGTDQSTGTITVAYSGGNAFMVYNTSGITLTSALGLMFHYTANAEL